MSDRSCQTASTPVRKCVECPARKDAARFEAALRDVIWRVDYVRSLLEEPAGAPHLQELVSLLDTSDVRAVLRLDEAEPDPATRTIQK